MATINKEQKKMHVLCSRLKSQKPVAMHQPQANRLLGRQILVRVALLEFFEQIRLHIPIAKLLVSASTYFFLCSAFSHYCWRVIHHFACDGGGWQK
jgi:hypothetical protein